MSMRLVDRNSIMWIALLAGTLFTSALQAQVRSVARDSEVGIPLLEHFNTLDLGLGPQNWSMMRDARGMMYVGNNDGILEFDGTSWRLIASPKGYPAFSIDLDKEGTLYVGGFNAFGRLVADSLGHLQPEILSSSLPQEFRSFSQVWETHAIGSTVWFRTEEALFSWDGSKCRVITSEHRLRQSVEVNDVLYVLAEGKGLCTPQGDSLHLLPGGEILARESEALVFIRPLSAGRLLVGANLAGVFAFDGRTWTPGWDFASSLPPGSKPIRAIPLADGSIAVGTVRNGVYILDASGEVIMSIDRSVGLGDNAVTGLFADQDQNLWVALDVGVARIEWPSPLTRFEKDSGLEGLVLDILRYEGVLYVGTTYGLYRLVPGKPGSKGTPRARPRFARFEAMERECFDLCITAHGLLAGGPRGVFLVDPGSGSLRQISSREANLLQNVDPRGDTVLVASGDGFSLLLYGKRGWSRKTVPGSPEGYKFQSMALDNDRVIWATSAQNGIVRIDAAKGIMQARFEVLDSTSGLTPGPASVSCVGGRARFINMGHLSIFDSEAHRFVRDVEFAKQFEDTLWNEPVFLEEDHFGRLWLQLEFTTELGYAVRKENGLFDFTYVPFGRVSGSYLLCMFVDEDSTAWFGGSNVLYRYDPRVAKSYRLPYRTLVRVVRTDREMLFNSNVFLEDFPSPELSFGHEPLTIEFSSTYYSARDRLFYRWRLEGRDTSWTAWTTQQAAVFRNLPEGDYCFRVEAQNVEGWRGDIAEFHFSVLPPWYRTWWAYLLYVLFVGLLFGTAWLWYRTRFLKRRSEELEQTVRERTAEIERKSREIQLQAEELERLDSIVRTVNRETRLPSVLEALLMQSLLFFPQADMALFVRRTGVGNSFRVIEAAGRHALAARSLEFTLRDLIGRSNVSMQRMQKGVYQLTGLRERIAEVTGGTDIQGTRFMAMSVLRARSLEGFLVLGSNDPDSFGPADLQRLLRLKEHVSSAVAKASAIEELENKNTQLDSTNRRLIDTQEQLVAQKKIAALGELTAGIAHEIQNPLNFVNNFSELSCELLDELSESLAGVAGSENEEILQNIALIRSNCDHIRQHGYRATAIVSAMIMHARSGSSHRDTVALNDLIDEFVMLTFKGMRLQFPQFQLDLQRSYDDKVGMVEVLPQELSRVIINICNNAWEAAIMRAAEEGDGMIPSVKVSSARIGERVHIGIRDNGPGLEPGLQERIFEPFFTTKRDSRNTGLGLSMSYEIINQLHRGKLSVRSEHGKYTEFVIMIPAP